MRAVRKVAERVADLADKIGKGYEDVEDAGHRSTSGEGVPPGRNGFRVSDPTGDVAVSGMHLFIRGKVRRAAAKLRDVEEPLSEVLRILEEAYGAYDPQHRENMARVRELEQTARTYQSNGHKP